MAKKNHKTSEDYIKFKFQRPQFYPNTATLIHLHILCGCFCTTTAAEQLQQRS